VELDAPLRYWKHLLAGDLIYRVTFVGLLGSLQVEKNKPQMKVEHL
jgi:hypothetical protein